MGSAARQEVFNRHSVITALWLVPVLLAVACGREPSDEKAVEEAFGRYVRATLNKEGTKVANLVTAGSVDYYEEIRQVASAAGPQEIGSRRLIDRLLVAFLRAEVSIDQLAKMTGRDVLTMSIERGWVGSETDIRGLRITEVNVQGDVAEASLESSGVEVPFAFTFRKQDGAWRFDITEFLPIGNALLKRLVSETDMEEDEFIFLTVESATGKRVNEEVWSAPSGES